MKSTILLCFLLKISLVLSAGVVSSDVTFRLYTRASPDNYILLQTGQLSGAALDSSKPFKFIIHGYISSADSQWVIDMKTAYLTKGDYNVIAVDWSGPATQLLYSDSATNTKDVGKYIALFITDLRNTLGVPFANVHLVGHSLGAQVSGFCGQYLLGTVGATVARITGMDPAGPLFVGVSADSRLSPGDAVFTDIIHTDGNEYGYYGVCGDIDFYPNGGTAVQPGCPTEVLTETDIASLVGMAVACSHLRAHEYHTESINSLGFISRKCNSYAAYLFGLCNTKQVAVMGENVDQSLRGVFYLTTNPSPPYARNGAI